MSAEQSRGISAPHVRSDVLAYIDQATYLTWHATGRSQVMQFVWVYERPVDMEALRRFHGNIGYAFAGRLIERSVLPFGRHRWVAATGPAAPLDVAGVRPPSELSDWIEERSQVRVDPVQGPGWHLGVLPMSDGTNAVTLVFSHCLLDGGAALRVVAEAVTGNTSDFGYRLPRSRKRLAALASDTRQVIRDLPEFGRTVVHAVKYAYRRRGEISSSGASRPPATQAVDCQVVLPAVSAIIDVADWDARAKSLGGNTYSLLAGISSLLGTRLGRVSPDDGSVTLLIAISDREGVEDRRGNAMKIATATVDPASVTTDLTATRSAVRTALGEVRDGPDDTHALLPVTPYVPRRAVGRTADLVFGDLPVSCSNVGVVPAEIAHPDGTDADYVMFRPPDQNVWRNALERVGGQLVVVAGEVVGTVSIGVVGYEVGAANTREWLADQLVATLDDFDLKATII